MKKYITLFVTIFIGLNLVNFILGSINYLLHNYECIKFTELLLKFVNPVNHFISTLLFVTIIFLLDKFNKVKIRIPNLVFLSLFVLLIIIFVIASIYLITKNVC